MHQHSYCFTSLLTFAICQPIKNFVSIILSYCGSNTCLISSEVKHVIGKVYIFYTKFAVPISFSISYIKYCPLFLFLLFFFTYTHIQPHTHACTCMHIHTPILSTGMYVLQGRNIDVFSILNIQSGPNKMLNKHFPN